MKRWLLIGGGVVVVVIVAVAVGLFSSINSLIQEAVEKYGSEITKTEVRLKEVDISPTSGKGVLRGLKVGNPEGFETESAFSLGEVSVILDIGTVTEDTIVIKEIVIEAPHVTYEMGAGGSNIDAIQRNVEAYLPKGGKKAAAGEKGEGPKLIIENLYLRNGRISVSATILQGKTLDVPLPDLHLRDIGKEDGGATPGEVVNEILATIQDSIGKAVGSLNIDLGGALKSVTEGASGIIESVTKGTGAGDIVDTVTKGTGGVTEAITKGTGDAGSAISEGAAKAGGALKKLFGN